MPKIRGTLNSNRFLQGNRIYLRDVKESDANQRYCKWLNDPEVNQYLEIRFSYHSIENLKEYILTTNEDPNYVFLAICLKQTGEHIGNIKLGPIDQNHKFSSMSLFIGQKKCWGKGFATEAISILTDFAFETLCLNKITCGCYEPNLGSKKAFEKVGYSLEGVFKKQYFYRGDLVDGFSLSFLREDWLKKKKEINE